jgi:uncharacterized damage-inducible protein DinB
LYRVVIAKPGPELELAFHLGESLLQLGVHGTHHRAQAINMLRQLGARTPPTDYLDWLDCRGQP